MRKITLMLCMLVLNVLAFAQNRTVTGTVQDENGNPVSFATITEAGTRNATAADANGAFTITIKQNGRLVVSAAGFQNQTLTVNGTTATVSLIRNETLSEVVVTGVGTATSKRKVAIDVATLNSKDVPKSAIASVEQALQGKIAGAQVQFTSGLPGSSAQIVLRGLNDLAGSGPMILVDGVEVNGGLTGLDLSTVDRVEVVKGAAAGTLYGAQGANGVIQIFTKKGGKNRKTSIDFRSQLSFDQIIKQNDLIAHNHHFVTDAQGYITRNGVRIAPDAKGAWPDPTFLDAVNPTDAPNIQNNKPYLEPVYDHIAQAYRKAVTQSHSINISGGGERSDYSFGASFLNQQNVLFNGYKRLNLTSNLGFELFHNFNFRTTTQYIITDEDLLAGGSRFNLTNSWPFIDFTKRDSTGHLVVKPKANENQLNPLAEREWRDRSQKQNRLVQSFNVNYRFPKFLELDYKFGAEIWNTDLTNYYHNQTSGLQSSQAYFGTNVAGQITDQFNKFTFLNSLASAYVRTDFEQDFKLKIPIRTTTQFSYDWRNERNRQYLAQGSILPSYPPYNISVAQNKTSSDYSDEFTTFGFLVNQTIDYGNLFGISGGVRSDYSSEFGDAKTAFTFPRGTVYFRPSELLKSPTLQDWKLRAAYGEAGIQPRRYARQITLDASTVGTGAVGLSTTNQASNPNLKVQRSKELELGTDVSIRTGKGQWLSNVTLSGTYWTRKSVDVIQSADLPPSTGYQTILDNLSSLSSHGIDLSLDIRALQSSKLDWNVGVRYGQFKGKVDKIANGKDIVTGIFGLQQGKDIGIIYASAPVTSLDQLRSDKTPYIASADRSKYEIVNGMVVDKTTKRVLLSDPNDQFVLGSVIPKFNASLINTITYNKGFTLSFQWDWRHGNKIYNLTRQWLYRDRLSKDFDQPVTINGQTGAWINYYNSLYNNVSPLGWFVEDGSFIRLRDLSLTYTLGENIRPKVFRSLALTLSGRNLVTFTNYSGLDPESTNTSDAQGNAATGVGAINGVDYFGVPNLKSYQIGLSIGF